MQVSGAQPLRGSYVACQRLILIIKFQSGIFLELSSKKGIFFFKNVLIGPKKEWVNFYVLPFLYFPFLENVS